jgi:hypothetical protein
LDKGYDAEYAHRMIRERLGAESVIPVRDMAEPARSGRKDRKVSDFYRGMMNFFFDTCIYDMRSIAETVNSMVKRVLGEILDGRDAKTRHSEMMFRCIANNFRVGMELRSSGMSV